MDIPNGFIHSILILPITKPNESQIHLSVEFKRILLTSEIYNFSKVTRLITSHHSFNKNIFVYNNGKKELSFS